MYYFRSLLFVVLFLSSSVIFSVDKPDIYSVVNQLSVTPNIAQKVAIKDKIKSVLIQGNTQIDTQNILPHITIKKGDPINPFKIRRSVKNIEKMGFFKDVSSSVDKTGNGIIVTFNVTENPKVSSISFENISLYSKEQRVMI